MYNSNLAHTLKETALNPLEMFPLARGALWRYSYTYSYYYVSDSVGTLWISRVGGFEVRVAGELARLASRRFTVETSVDLSTEYRNEDTFHSGASSTRYRRMASRQEHELVLLRGNLWYDQGRELEYMLPATFLGGGYVNLELFNYPGVPDFPGRYNLFNQLLGPGAYAGGRYVYAWKSLGPGVEQKRAEFSAGSLGPVALAAVTERDIKDTVLREKLELQLVDHIPGRLAW